jgi:g-D-glutamyl-meso-diaminopimelate peptidase
METKEGRSMRGEEVYGQDHATLLRVLLRAEKRFRELSVLRIGKSILGRPIPCAVFGEGAEPILYVGAHHGMEHITAGLLLRFLSEILTAAARDETVEGVRAAYLLRTRRYYVVPMLNPDGVELAMHGASPSSPLYGRQLRMNGGSGDFSHWQANARGVDLNHNYDAGFSAYKRIEQELGIEGGGPTRYSGEYPESEPETAALAGLVRTVMPRLILTLHTQGEEIYYTSGGYSLPRQRSVARAMARLSGYRAAEPEGPAAYGGLTDWAIAALGIPSYTIECGKGENPLPYSSLSDIYFAVKPILFCAPIL